MRVFWIGLMLGILTLGTVRGFPEGGGESRPTIAGVPACAVVEETSVDVTTAPRYCCHGTLTHAGTAEVYVTVSSLVMCASDAKQTEIPFTSDVVAVKPDTNGAHPFEVCAALPREATCATSGVKAEWIVAQLAYITVESPKGTDLFGGPLVGVIFP